MNLNVSFQGERGSSDNMQVTTPRPEESSSSEGGSRSTTEDSPHLRRETSGRVKITMTSSMGTHVGSAFLCNHNQDAFRTDFGIKVVGARNNSSSRGDGANGRNHGRGSLGDTIMNDNDNYTGTKTNDLIEEAMMDNVIALTHRTETLPCHECIRPTMPRRKNRTNDPNRRSVHHHAIRHNPSNPYIQRLPSSKITTRTKRLIVNPIINCRTCREHGSSRSSSRSNLVGPFAALLTSRMISPLIPKPRAVIKD